MDWKDDRFRPSKREYEQFSERLENSNNDAVESGIKISLLMLIGFPFLGLLITLIVVRIAGSVGSFSLIAVEVLFLSGMIFFSTKAYQGITKRQVRVIPPSRIKQRSEASYVGGKLNEYATGKDALIVGIVFLLLGLVCFRFAVKYLVLLMEAIN
jgi:quinol-cytochrome oxidoreductase complex cytochrome b subunit